jgi:hypothetical protein
MAVPAKRNAVVEGVITAICFLNDMVAFHSNVHMFLAKAAPSLTSHQSRLFDVGRKWHLVFYP